MRNHVILIVLFAAVIASACKTHKKPNCSQLKTGNFIFRTVENGKPNAYLINRNGSLQTEVNQATGDTTMLTVKWIDSCTYDMSFIPRNTRQPNAMDTAKAGMIITTEILKSNSEYYLFKSQSNRSGLVLKDTMWLRD